MIPLSDLRLMQVKVSPLGVSGDKIMAERQMAERLDMLEACGEMPLRPPSVRGFLFCGSRMSAMSQSRRGGIFRTRPLFPLTTDTRRGGWHICYVPKLTFGL
jgi:hypothetical protein